MKAAEWINLISNDRDRKFARAACAEVLDEASVPELIIALMQHKPDCLKCFNGSSLRQPSNACCQSCMWDTDKLKTNFKEII